jgi:RNA recognition motif-containing protein
MMEETPSKKKTPVKVVEPEEDSDDSDEEVGSDDDMSDEVHSDEGGSDVEDEAESGSEDDAEEEEGDSEEEKVEEKPQQKKAKKDNKPTAAAPNKPNKKKEDREISNPDKTIFVGNLPKEITQEKIKKMFSKYGKISSVRLRSAPIEDPRVAKKVAVIK